MRTRRRTGLLAVLAGLLVTVALTPVNARFTGVTGDGANAWQATSLQPPSNLTVTQTCASGTPSVSLSWTATPSTFATGYHLTRVGGPTQTVTPYTATTAGDGPLSNSTAYTWQLSAYVGNWTSSPVSVSLTTYCPPQLVTGSAVGSASASGPDLTLTAPSGLQAGDVMLAQIARDQSNGNLNNTWTVPAGWTLATQTGDPNSNQTYSAIWWKLATAADVPGTTTYTWSAPNGNLGTAEILAYRGVDQTTPIDTTSASWGASGTSLSAPSVTTSTANEVLIAFYAIKDKTVTLTLPAGMNAQYDYVPASSPDFCVGAADELIASAGTTGARTASSTSGKSWTAQLVALRP